ncbi:3111_t:CDS:2, partial [Gigaspora rosea]
EPKEKKTLTKVNSTKKVEKELSITYPKCIENNLGKSNQETLVEDKNTKKSQTKQPLVREALQLACDNWTRKVSKFQKASSKKPIGVKITEVKNAPDIDNSDRDRIKNTVSEWKLKSAEGLEKAYETWKACRTNLNMDIKNKISKPEIDVKIKLEELKPKDKIVNYEALGKSDHETLVEDDEKVEEF